MTFTVNGGVGNVSTRLEIRYDERGAPSASMSLQRLGRLPPAEAEAAIPQRLDIAKEAAALPSDSVADREYAAGRSTEIPIRVDAFARLAGRPISRPAVVG